MKKVYIIERGQLNKRENKFELYISEVFSSRKKAIAEIESSFVINKGYNRVDSNGWNSIDDMITYDTVCTNWEGIETIATVRYTIKEMELR